MYGSKTKNFLRSFNVGNTYSGFQYCAYSVMLVSETPDRLTSVTKCIYPDVAKKYKTTPKCVERNIRTVAEKVWKNGGQEFFYNINGEQFEKRPSNAKFLEMLVNYIVYEETPKGPCRECNLVAEYKEQILKLEEELKKSNEVISWMHELIWRLIKERKDIT